MPAASSGPVIPQLIIGLGNPGQKYDHTRHNVGFDAVDRLAASWGIALSEERKFQGVVGSGRGPHGEKIHLLKPLTYMNRSGQSVRAVLDWYKLQPESVMVIYDDMDLPLGKLRLRLSGSAGSHNGMKSLVAHLSTQNFPRLRIGIGAPKTPSGHDKDTVSHVLGQFAAEEKPLVTAVLNLVTEVTEVCFGRGVEMAMNRYNNLNLAESVKSAP